MNDTQAEKLLNLFVKRVQDKLNEHGSKITFVLGKDFILSLIEDFQLRYEATLEIMEEKGIITKEVRNIKALEMSTPSATSSMYRTMFASALTYSANHLEPQAKENFLREIDSVDSLEQVLPLFINYFGDDSDVQINVLLKGMVDAYKYICEKSGIMPDNIVSML